MKRLRELFPSLIPSSKGDNNHWHYLNKVLYKCKLSKDSTYKLRCKFGFGDVLTGILESTKLRLGQEILGGSPKNE